MTRRFLSAFLVVYMVQLISGVSISLAFFSFVYLGTQVVTGSLIARYLLNRKLNLPESMGIGFAIGSLVALCVDQLLVETFLSPFSWLFVPLGAFVILVVPFFRKSVLCHTDALDPKFLFLLFLVLSILVQERYWPLYIALAIIPLLVLQEFKLESFRPKTMFFARCSLSLVFIFTTMKVLADRPSLWWNKTQDFQFFEALSYSLTHWGSNDQVFVQGQSILYHWFSYAWMGLATKALGAPTWVMQTKIAPIFVSLALIYLVFALLRRFGITGWRASLVVVIFVLLNDFNFESFSMVFSYIWLLAFVFFLIHWSEHHHWRLIFASSFMAAGAFGAKSSNVVVIVAGCGMLFLFLLVQREIKSLLVFAHGLAIALALGIVYLRLYFDSPYDATINSGTLGIAQDIFGDVASLPRFQFVFWSIIILLNLLLVYIVAAISTRNSVNTEFRAFWWFFIGTIVVTTSTLLVTVSDYEQEEYFLHAFVLFGSLVVGIAVCDFIQLLSAKNNWKPLVVSSIIMLLCAGAARFAFWDNKSGEFWAIRSRIANSSSIVALLISATLVGIILRKRVSAWHTALAFVACSTLVTAFTSNDKWFKYQQRFRDEVSQPQFADFMVGPTDIQTFLREAKTLIPQDAIVASNYECDEPVCPSDSVGYDRLNWKVGGEAMLMTIYLERRMFISGYGFLWQNVELPDFAKERMRLSSEFATSPTEGLASQLRQQGVDFFIVDRSRANKMNGTFTAQVLLEDQRFKLLQL